MMSPSPSHSRHRISRLLVSLISMCAACAAAAQTNAIVAHYYEVPNLYSPAMAGLTDKARIRAGARWQWVGVDHAPRSYALLADAPFRLADCSMGAGIVVLSDSYQQHSSLQASAQIGTKLSFGHGTLSIALQGGIYSQKLRAGDALIPDEEPLARAAEAAEPVMRASSQSADLGIGIAYSRSAWHIGLSCQHITNPAVKLGTTDADGNTDDDYKFVVKRTLYFDAGCNIAIKNTLFEVMPSIIASTDFSSHHGIASVRARYNRTFTAGLGYRYREGLCVMLGAEFKGFYVGYGYEHSTSAMGKSSSGSHEAWLGYAFKLDLDKKAKHRHRSVRFM